MHVDITEITAIQFASQGPRFDGYRGIHKALRMLMGQMLTQAGQLDSDDDHAVAALCADLIVFCDLFASHLEHENTFIHPALEARAPGTSQRIAGEHVQHERDIAALRASVRALQQSAADERTNPAHVLYLQLSLFVAHNLAHMFIEETVHNTALWHHYSDEELQAIEGQIIASLPPDTMMSAMRWMIPALSPQERNAVVSGIKAGAPAEVTQAIMELSKSVLSTSDWSRLASAIDYCDAAGQANHRG